MLKIHVVFLANRKMKIKTTLRFHLNPVKMVKIITKFKCKNGCGEKDTLIYCWRECVLVQPVWKYIYIFFQVIKGVTLE